MKEPGLGFQPKFNTVHKAPKGLWTLQWLEAILPFPAQGGRTKEQHLIPMTIPHQAFAGANLEKGPECF